MNAILDKRLFPERRGCGVPGSVDEGGQSPAEHVVFQWLNAHAISNMGIGISVRSRSHTVQCSSLGTVQKRAVAGNARSYRAASPAEHGVFERLNERGTS